MIELKEMLNVNGNLYIYLRTSQWFDNLFMTRLNDVNILGLQKYLSNRQLKVTTVLCQIYLNNTPSSEYPSHISLD